MPDLKLKIMRIERQLEVLDKMNPANRALFSNMFMHLDRKLASYLLPYYHNIIVQENPYDLPYLFYKKMSSYYFDKGPRATLSEFREQCTSLNLSKFATFEMYILGDASGEAYHTKFILAAMQQAVIDNNINLDYIHELARVIKYTNHKIVIMEDRVADTICRCISDRISRPVYDIVRQYLEYAVR